jgi:stage II sporulation protein D
MGMTPNPGRGNAPAAEDRPSGWGESLPERAVRTRDIDFARAFEEAGAPRRDTDPAAAGGRKTPAAHSLRYPPVKLQRRHIRVLLKRGAEEAVAYSTASAQVNTPNGSVSFRGRMVIDASYKLEKAVVATVNNVKKELRLPCTLAVASTMNMLELGEESYRGAIIIVPESAGAVTFINALHVEDYLRGVVPLEIGSLSEAEAEALKAQAIAARTYAYKRMSLNGGKPFDVASTVADQVYGGANAEAAATDAAISATKDLVIAYNDDIIDAYYHSTCGGQTANAEDVWGGEGRPYLLSRSDADKGGKPYCGQSAAFRWTETWGMSRLSNIIKQHAGEGNFSPGYGGGALRRIEVSERHQCGRVKELAVVTSAGKYVTSGEKARFVLRRNNAPQQILRSSNFNSAVIANGEITITGAGYGHGVGMCQVGAIARARAGENFEQILRAYYTDIAIRTAAD